jgi:pimeloyl-ACP methyl ester carboxylesterase
VPDVVVDMLSALTEREVSRGETDRGGRTVRWVETAGPGPTIVLEAGLGEPVPTWAPVFAGLSAIGRVLAYDRAGIGLSDPAPEIDSAARLADLAAVLDDAKAGPCVLVAHSLGGIFAQIVAWQYPDQVAGLVLIDPSHEDTLLHVPPELREVQVAMMRKYLTMTAEKFVSDSRTSWEEEAAALSDDPKIRELVLESWIASFATRDRVQIIFDEEKECDEYEPRARELRGICPTLTIPMVVLSATNGIPAAIRTKFTELQADVAAASGGEHVIVPDSGHYIHREKPQVVIDAVRRTVDRVRRAAGGDGSLILP